MTGLIFQNLLNSQMFTNSNPFRIHYNIGIWQFDIFKIQVKKYFSQNIDNF